MENTSIKLSRDGNTFVVKIGDQTAFFSTNLIKYHLGIAYTKKDGEFVSEKQIKERKELSKQNYIAAIKNNKKASA